MPQGKWEDSYKFLYLPQEPDQLTKGREQPKAKSPTKGPLQDITDRTNERSSPAKSKKSPSPTKSSPMKAQAATDRMMQSESKLAPIKPPEKLPEKPQPKPEERSKIPWFRAVSDTVTSYGKFFIVSC